MPDLIDKQAIEHVCGHIGDTRLSACSGRPLGSRAERLKANHDHLIGAEIDCRLDRAVETRPTVRVMTAGGPGYRHLHGREQDRNRCGGADVLAAQASLDIPDLVARTARNVAVAGDEADRLTRRKQGRDHAYGVHVARRDVALEALPVDPAIEASRQRGGIEHTREPDARQPERMANQSEHHTGATAADDGRHHILLAQPFP